MANTILVILMLFFFRINSPCQLSPWFGLCGYIPVILELASALATLLAPLGPLQAMFKPAPGRFAIYPNHLTLVNSLVSLDATPIILGITHLSIDY